MINKIRKDKLLKLILTIFFSSITIAFLLSVFGIMGTFISIILYIAFSGFIALIFHILQFVFYSIKDWLTDSPISYREDIIEIRSLKMFSILLLPFTLGHFLVEFFYYIRWRT